MGQPATSQSRSRLIAVVEDEKDIAELITYNLGKAGYQTHKVPDGNSFLFALKNSEPDLVILDLMLPGTDGLAVCRQMKSDPKHKGIPIIMVTARGTEADRVVGLELGADDYVVKPFSPRELVARVGAVLRRAETKNAVKEVIRVGQLVIDPNQALVTLRSKPLDLTTTELKILELLGSSLDRVFSRDQIIEYVWGYDKPVVDRTVDVHIMNLREKLGPLADRIRAIRGLGYKFTSG
jgi:two-component system, OmpR family, phosphate regulon response regulator PhoB